MSDAMLPRKTVYLHRMCVNVFVLLLCVAISVVFGDQSRKNTVVDVFSLLMVFMPFMVIFSLVLEHAIPRLEDDSVKGKLSADISISDWRYSIALWLLLLLAWRLELRDLVFPAALMLFGLLSASIGKVVYFHLISDQRRA